MKPSATPLKPQPTLAYKRRPAALGAWWLRTWRWCQATAQKHAVYTIAVVALLALLPALVARSYWHSQILLADITVSDDRPASPLAVAGFERTTKTALEDWINHKSAAKFGQMLNPLTSFAAPVFKSSSPLRNLLDQQDIGSSRKHFDVQLPGQRLGLLALADKVAHALPGHRESFEISLDGVFTGEQFKVQALVHSSRSGDFAFQVQGARQEAYASDSALFQALATQLNLITDPDNALPIVLHDHITACRCFDAQAQAMVIQQLPRLSAYGLGVAAAYVAQAHGVAQDSPSWHYTQGLIADQIETRIQAHPGDNGLRGARLVQGLLNPTQPLTPAQLVRDLAPACFSVEGILTTALGLRCTSIEPMVQALYYQAKNQPTQAWASLQKVPEPSAALRVLAISFKNEQCQTSRAGPCQFEAGQWGLQGAALAQANAQLRLLQAKRHFGLPSSQRAALLADIHQVLGADSSSACLNLWGIKPCESTWPLLTAIIEIEASRLAGHLGGDYALATTLCERARRALPDSAGALQCHAGALEAQGRFEQARNVWLASLAIGSQDNALAPAGLNPSHVHFSLATLAFNQGRWGLAAKHLDQSKAAEAAEPNKQFWFADGLADDRAMLALRQCKPSKTKLVHPGRLASQASLMQAAQAGQWAMVRQALQVDPDTPPYPDPRLEVLLARAEFGLGHAEEAMRRLRSTIERWPEAYDPPRWLYLMRRQSGALALAGDEAERQRLKLSGQVVRAIENGRLIETWGLYQNFDDMNHFHQCRLKPAPQTAYTTPRPSRVSTQVHKG
jgi:tetratricopeptide (TPR) repeat protein